MAGIQGSDQRSSKLAEVPLPPPPPHITRTEQLTWFAYGVIAILLLAIPLATHSFGIPDIAAWVLLVATVGMAAFWLRNGELRGPEWLRPEDYERYLKAIQRIPRMEEDQPAPPTLT